VLIDDGSTVHTATGSCSCSSSIRSDWAKPRTPCLAAQYADCKGTERRPSAEATLMIVPVPARCITDSAAFMA
jgi:hypothetical protein